MGPSRKQQSLAIAVALLERDFSEIQQEQLLSLDSFSLNHALDEKVWVSPKVYFIAQRPHGEFAGCWEFPGGKIEANESEFQGLCREVNEEVAVTVQSAEPFLRIMAPAPPQSSNPHPRQLAVWRVTDFKGEPHGAEGQIAHWNQLTWSHKEAFLGPNQHMFTALRLKPCFAFVDFQQMGLDEFQRLSLLEWQRKIEEFLEYAQLQHKALDQNLMIRLRFDQKHSEHFSPKDYYQLLDCFLGLLHNKMKRNTPVNHYPDFIIDALPDMQQELLALLGKYNSLLGRQVSSVYFSSRWQKLAYKEDLLSLMEQLDSVYPELLKGSSCHSETEIRWVQQVQMQYICLSPAQATFSHPEATPIGWEAWELLSDLLMQPCYALGGVGIQQLPQVKTAGGYGIAGISFFQKSQAELKEQWQQSQEAMTQIHSKTIK